MSANQRQVGGEHYKTGGREHWDIVVEHDLDYFQGQITKYVMRWKKKNGVEDLRKAQHFLEKYIEVAEAEDEAAGYGPDQNMTDYHGDAGPGYVNQD